MNDDPEINEILGKLPDGLRPADVPARAARKPVAAPRGNPPLSYTGIRRLAQAGFSGGEIAEHFGISRRTFYYRLRDDAALADSFKIGRARFSAKIQDRVLKLAFEMKNRTALFKLARQLGIDGKDRDWPQS
ncbi:hypothetical protein FE249_11215 [Acidiphilium multivorum]|uniref:helix-turn-helix domain-containing protein n=1 Tax=Acidiphilium multivorum TaxID=62140 RepID=UPI001F4BEA9A|nr:helix-turn-helix domain-containing protein [Acidiphilium multivorum]UNC14755.1 hypothetical protein FE249_11215 [Acidiphilium multivorum]